MSLQQLPVPLQLRMAFATSSESLGRSLTSLSSLDCDSRVLARKQTFPLRTASLLYKENALLGRVSILWWVKHPSCFRCSYLLQSLGVTRRGTLTSFPPWKHVVTESFSLKRGIGRRSGPFSCINLNTPLRIVWCTLVFVLLFGHVVLRIVILVAPFLILL